MNRRKSALFAAATVIIFFAALEIVLRVAGFGFGNAPRFMEFNYPDPHTLYEIFEPDPATLWRLKPGVGMGPGIEPISASGFRGPAFDVAKKPGVTRVLCVGDSVTFGAEETYPHALRQCLGERFEVINFGVPGYSSLLGLKMFETRGAALKPDVVVVMFGWNDHWLAKGRTDAEQFEDSAKNSAASYLGGVRIFQLVAMIVRGMAGEKNMPTKNRVSLTEYDDNLRRIVAAAESSGAKVVMMTAPSAISIGKLPDFLVHLRFMEGDPSEPAADVLKRLDALHGSYNDVVRKVASETGAVLIDLDAMWAARGVGDLFRDPSNDVTHPNPAGYRLIGQTLCDTILKSSNP